MGSAARLFKKSIISVDSEDVPLIDYEEEEKKQDDDEKKDDGADEKKGDDDGDDDQQQSQQLTINYNAYMRTANLIVYFIRRKESEPESGIKQALIENLVMKEKESEMESDEDMERENKLLKFIIHRLIEIDHILLIKQDNTDDVTERVLIVHPNYDPDSRNTANLAAENQETQYQHDKKKKIQQKQ